MLAWACLGLFTGQLTGLHMHVNGYGYAGVPVGTHVHRTEIPQRSPGLATHHEPTNHDHDHHHDRGPGDPTHDGDADVSAIGLAAGVSKLIVFFVWVALAFVCVLRVRIRIPMPLVLPRPRPRHERWRPPLRAPPAFSHA